MPLNLCQRIQELHETGGWDAVQTWLDANHRRRTVESVIEPEEVANKTLLLQRRDRMLTALAPHLVGFTQMEVPQPAEGEPLKAYLHLVFIAPVSKAGDHK